MKKLLQKDYLSETKQVHIAFYDAYHNINSEIHTHDFFEIFLMIEGEILHKVNTKTEILTKGSIVLIRPSDCHSFLPTKNNKCKHINLAFSYGVLNTLCDYFDININTHTLFKDILPPTFLLSYHQLQFVTQKINPIKKAFLTNESSLINFEFKKVLYDLFVLFLDKNISKTNKSEIPKWISSLVKEMYSSQNFALGVPKMVALSGVSAEHLSRIFKTYYKITPIDFIKQLRINYSINQLLYSNTQINNIAIDCGYDSLSHFYKVFKQHTNLTPGQYRSLHQKHFLT